MASRRGAVCRGATGRGSVRNRDFRKVNRPATLPIDVHQRARERARRSTFTHAEHKVSLRLPRPNKSANPYRQSGVRRAPLVARTMSARSPGCAEARATNRCQNLAMVDICQRRREAAAKVLALGKTGPRAAHAMLQRNPGKEPREEDGCSRSANTASARSARCAARGATAGRPWCVRPDLRGPSRSIA